MVDLLALANETEMTRLDYARVNGTHAHAVELLALDVEKRVVVYVTPLLAIVRISQRLKPRMV